MSGWGWVSGGVGRRAYLLTVTYQGMGKQRQREPSARSLSARQREHGIAQSGKRGSHASRCDVRLRACCSAETACLVAAGALRLVLQLLCSSTGGALVRGHALLKR